VGALIRSALLAGALVSVSAQASPVDRWRAFIEQASVRFGIPARWIEQVMIAESGGLPVLDGKPIRSRAGAIGLMQLMPATWAAMRARFKLGENPDDPADNILAGAGFLRLMYDRFGYPGLFAAYNAGPGLYARAQASGVALPAETRAYLASVTSGIVAQARPPARPLFVVRHDAVEAEKGEIAPRSAALFAVQKSLP
jgi:soluble lytic murein transglycosylase-like protein